MKFQLPRPWLPDGEYRLYQDGLAQIELADRLGYDCAWQVEHHFLEEYAHSPTPEMFLSAASQRTKNIRLGHGHAADDLAATSRREAHRNARSVEWRAR
jgi:alkanesulfonate monooxygenase SsuD/methylene tetrahydromethanopterin reductase-like flavin-dependent oxidoreductase (luciferase family)